MAVLILSDEGAGPFKFQWPIFPTVVTKIVGNRRVFSCPSNHNDHTIAMVGDSRKYRVRNASKGSFLLRLQIRPNVTSNQRTLDSLK